MRLLQEVLRQLRSVVGECECVCGSSQILLEICGVSFEALLQSPCLRGLSQ